MVKNEDEICVAMIYSRPTAVDSISHFIVIKIKYSDMYFFLGMPIK